MPTMEARVLAIDRMTQPTDGRDDIAIKAQGLTKVYGKRVAVDALSFAVPTGSVCGFIGPNGAGKTTTIRMLLGLVAPTAGTATVLGVSIENPIGFLPRVGAMIEGPAFYPGLSGRRNLEVLSTLAGIDRRQVDPILQRVGMSDRADDLFRSYSLGMRQRIGIGAALLHEPALLILDEPTNGLDPPGIREIRDLMRGLADDGLTVLVSSHLLDELQHVCDYVVMIRNGTLVFDGPVDALLAEQRPELHAATDDPEDVVRLLEIAARAGFPATTDRGAVLVTAPATWAGELNRQAFAAGIVLTSLTAIEPRLEDIFFELTEGTPE
jgi:ABC-2 type transport system ATP-binding protein